MKSHNVFLEGPAEHNDIIKVYQANLPMKSCQDPLHHTFECRRSIGQAKWHYFEIKQSHMV